MTLVAPGPVLSASVSQSPVVQGLAATVRRALDPSDTVVLLLDLVHDALWIAAANEEAQRATGYRESELTGQPFALLTGKDTDPGAMEALLAAARQGVVHRTRLRLSPRAGPSFWLGMKLLPAHEPGMPSRFVVMGRDISARLRAEEQSQVVQGLLAKVFVVVDEAVYIIDPQGRFVMANPAFERLVGVPAGSLTGSDPLDHIEPICHPALAAKAKQQLADGMDYTLSTTLRGPGGSKVKVRLTSVIAQRDDLLRFRIVTVRPDAAPVPVTRVTAAGRIQLMGLDAVRERLGQRWEALKDRVMATAEHVVRSQLGPLDAFFRTEDQGFVICFANVGEEEARFRAASIGTEVRRRLIGDGEHADVAHVFSAATDLPPGGDALSKDDLASLVNKRIQERLVQLQETARTQLVEALQGTGYVTEGVHTRERVKPLGSLVQLSPSVLRAVDAAIAVLPAAETAGLDKDTMLLGLAQQCAVERALSNPREPIFVVLSPDILLEKRRFEACLAALAAMGELPRQQMVLIVTAPADGGWSRLSTSLPRLRPFCRTLGLSVPSLDPGGMEIRYLGVSLIVVGADACGGPPGWEAKVKTRGNALRSQQCRLMIQGSLTFNAPVLFANGADLVSIASAGAAVKLRVH